MIRLRYMHVLVYPYLWARGFSGVFFRCLIDFYHFSPLIGRYHPLRGIGVKNFGLTLKAHGMCMFWRSEKGGPGGLSGVFGGVFEVFD